MGSCEGERETTKTCSYLQGERQEVSTLDWQPVVSRAQAEKQQSRHKATEQAIKVKFMS